MTDDVSAYLNRPLRTEAQAMAQRWKVGRRYYARGSVGRRSIVRVLANDIRGKHPIAGAVSEEEGGAEVLLDWLPDGRLTRDGGTLDLTLDEVPGEETKRGEA